MSDKGFIEFFKTISKLGNLKELKMNLMNNEFTEKAMKNGAPYL